MPSLSLSPLKKTKHHAVPLPLSSLFSLRVETSI